MKAFQPWILGGGGMLTDSVISLGSSDLGNQSIIDVIDFLVTGYAQSI